MNPKYIEVTLGNHIIVHGYDSNNKEITEKVSAPNNSKKVLAISRIKSLSEKYILTDYIDGRWIYWEYKESYEYVKNLIL